MKERKGGFQPGRLCWKVVSLMQMEVTGRGAVGGRGRRVGQRDGGFSLGHVFEVPEQQPYGTIQNTLENGRSGGGMRSRARDINLGGESAFIQELNYRNQ